MTQITWSAKSKTFTMQHFRGGGKSSLATKTGSRRTSLNSAMSKNADEGKNFADGCFAIKLSQPKEDLKIVKTNKTL